MECNNDYYDSNAGIHTFYLHGLILYFCTCITLLQESYAYMWGLVTLYVREDQDWSDIPHEQSVLVVGVVSVFSECPSLSSSPITPDPSCWIFILSGLRTLESRQMSACFADLLAFFTRSLTPCWIDSRLIQMSAVKEYHSTLNFVSCHSLPRYNNTRCPKKFPYFQMVHTLSIPDRLWTVMRLAMKVAGMFLLIEEAPAMSLLIGEAP